MRRQRCIVVGFALCMAVSFALSVCRLLDRGPRAENAGTDTPKQLQARGTLTAVVTSVDPVVGSGTAASIPEVDSRHALLLIVLLIATRRTPLRRPSA